MNWELLLQFVGPGAIGVASATGIGLYFKYRGDKPKNNAEAEAIRMSTIAMAAAEWKKLYEENDLKLDRLEKAFKELENKFNVLFIEATNLRSELARYRKIENRTEVAREDLHHSVDESIDSIKKTGV